MRMYEEIQWLAQGAVSRLELDKYLHMKPTLFIASLYCTVDRRIVVCFPRLVC